MSRAPGPRPRLVAAAGLVVVLVLVAACQGVTSSAESTTVSPTVTTSAQSPPSSSLSPAPSVTHGAAGISFDASVAPSRPAGLLGPPSEKAADEAARYFVSLFPYVFATGDLESWESMSGTECEWCAAIAGIVRTEIAAGKRREGGRMDVADVQAFHDSGEKYVVVVRLLEQPSRVLGSDGTVVERTDFVQDAKLELALRWSGETWSVTSVGVDLLGTS